MNTQQRSAAQRLAEAPTAEPHGGKRDGAGRKADGETQGSVSTLNQDKPKQKRDSTYLAARLKRDHPEIAARVEAGEVARRQTDPESPEFVKPEGGAPKANKNASKSETTVSNDYGCSASERNSKSGTLRRLARKRPELDIDLSGFECDPLPDLVIDLPEIVIEIDPEAYS